MMGLQDWYTVLRAAHGCAGRKRPHKDCKQILPLFDGVLRPRCGALPFLTCNRLPRELREVDFIYFPRKTGAGEGIRTLDPNLGKVVLYP